MVIKLLINILKKINCSNSKGKEYYDNGKL